MKLGQEVKAKAARGAFTTGRYASKSVDGRGSTWLKVNVAPKGKPAVVKLYRPSQVTEA